METLLRTPAARNSSHFFLLDQPKGMEPVSGTSTHLRLKVGLWPQQAVKTLQIGRLIAAGALSPLQATLHASQAGEVVREVQREDLAGLRALPQRLHEERATGATGSAGGATPEAGRTLQ